MLITYIDHRLLGGGGEGNLNPTMDAKLIQKCVADTSITFVVRTLEGKLPAITFEGEVKLPTIAHFLGNKVLTFLETKSEQLKFKVFRKKFHINHIKDGM